MGRKILIIGVLFLIAGVLLTGLELRRRRIANTVPANASFANPTGKPQPISPDSYQESRVRIGVAWGAYWYTSLPAAMELFKKEHDEHPNAYYNQGYTATVLKELPEYDKALKGLQAGLNPDISDAERDEIYLKIYKLSKEFYENCGIETEASGPRYGPEFLEAEEKVGDHEEPAANKLIREWSHYDSCTDDVTAAKAEVRLENFLQKFPDSSRKKQIADLLEYYKSGSAICGHKKTVQRGMGSGLDF